MRLFKLFLALAILAIALFWILFVSHILNGLSIDDLGATFRAVYEKRAELKTAKLEKEIVGLSIEQERERQKTAVLTAKLAKERAEQERQAAIQATPLVVKSRTLAAAAWPVMPLFLLASAMTGGALFFVFRRTPVETPFVKVLLPVRTAAAIAERSLQVSNSAEMARVLAYSEEITAGRMNSAANLYKSLKGHAGRDGMTSQALPEHVEPQATQDAGNVSFQQAVKDFRAGLVLIGYDTAGNPVYFALKDFVSCAFGGGSGSGKTSKLRFLVAQMALSGVNVSILDAHAGNEQALVDSLGNLASLPNVRIFNPFETADAVNVMLQEVQAAIQAGKPADAPCVYILDELRPLNRACDQVETLMDILSNEGRKYNQFGVFASQTWEAKMFKQAGSSARDACVLKMAARMPKEQARILFKDGDSARQVAKLARPDMFADSAAFSGVVTVPFCSKDDLNSLVPNVSQKTPSISSQVTSGTTNGGNVNEETADAPNVSEVKLNNLIPFPKRDTTTQANTETTQADTADSTGNTDDTTLLTAALESCENDKKMLAERSGVSLSLIKEIQAGRRRITADTRQKLECVLHDTEKVGTL